MLASDMDRASGCAPTAESPFPQFRVPRSALRDALVGQVALLLGVDEAGAAEVVAERGEVDRAAYDLGEAHRVHRLEHVGLGLDHLVLQRILELLAGEPDQPQPEE